MPPVAFEDRVLTHRDLHVQIAGGPTFRTRLALTGQADAITSVDARRDLDRQGFAFLDTPLAVALATGVGDHLAATAAGGAGLLHLEEALLHPHLADAPAGGTGYRRAALAGAGAVAFLAGGQGRHLDFRRRAANGLLEGNIQGITQVRAALGTAAAAAAATEDIPEYVAKDVAEAPGATAEASAAHVRVNPGMPEAVIGRTLLRVHQNVVGLGGFLELVVGLGVVGIPVRVVLHRHPSVGLLDFLLVGPLTDAEHLVVIAFGHGLVTLFANDNAGQVPALTWLIGIPARRRGARVPLTSCRP